MNPANGMWQEKLGQCLGSPQFISKPRGMEVRERLAESYTTVMPAYLDLEDRKVNLPFMFAEAAWIVGGSNRLEDLTPYMDYYKNFSDDGIFLKGAYGPKVVDQLPYVVSTLLEDNDSRQAYLNIWRERPGSSKDIPCTTGMQFLIREMGDEKFLFAVVTMRSNDVVLGLTYDIFTFSMVAKAVQLLLREQGLNVALGELTVNPGSLHLYERHYEEAEKWLSSEKRDMTISAWVSKIQEFETYSELIRGLVDLAHESKFYRDRVSQ